MCVLMVVYSVKTKHCRYSSKQALLLAPKMPCICLLIYSMYLCKYSEVVLVETGEMEGKRRETVQVTLGQELQTWAGGSQGHIVTIWRGNTID